MSFTYAVVGAGRQGVAAAYDLAVRGDASRILFVDLDEAARASRRQGQHAHGLGLAARRGDASDVEATAAQLAGTQAILSAATTRSPRLTRAARAIGAHMVDLGATPALSASSTGSTRGAPGRHQPSCRTPAWGRAQRVAGRLCDEQAGSPPGGAHLGRRAPAAAARAVELRSTFAMSGLTNEYDGVATSCGKAKSSTCRRSMASNCSGSTSGRHARGFRHVGRLVHRALDLEGHARATREQDAEIPGALRAFHCLPGARFARPGPDPRGAASVVPRDVFHALLEPHIGAGSEPARDVCVMRVKATGEKHGRPAEALVELVDRYDEATGFTAMQRLTGWHAAICLELAVRGGSRRG